MLQKLLKLGVPVCIKCGSDLRGLPVDRERCPECGRDIGRRVRRMMSETPSAGLSPRA